jgi:hypothetical protein
MKAIYIEEAIEGASTVDVRLDCADFPRSPRQSRDKAASMAKPEGSMALSTRAFFLLLLRTILSRIPIQTAASSQLSPW